MAIADFDTYKAEIAAPFQRADIAKAALTTIAGRTSSSWRQLPFEGAVPTTAVVPTRATAGALIPHYLQNGGSNPRRMPFAEIGMANAGTIILCDRLAHSGGLVADVTTAQTTNLPSATLTRSTSGVGVMAAVEIYTQIGSTATTATCNYKDQGGNSAVSEQFVIGGTGFRDVGRMLIIPLVGGDTGVTEVSNLDLVATTGTAGGVGITLFKPLMAFPIQLVGGAPHIYDSLLNLCGVCPEIEDDACLFFMYITQTTSTGIMNGTFRFIEE